MANHAHYYFEGEVKLEDIVKSFEETIKLYNIPWIVVLGETEKSEETEDYETCIEIRDPNSEHFLGIQYFFHTMCEFMDCDEDGNEFVKLRAPCLEVRHGHRFDLLWQIEDFIMLELQKKFKFALYSDEGIVEFNYKPLKSFEIRMKERFGHGAIFSKFLEWNEMHYHRKYLPESYHHLLYDIEKTEEIIEQEKMMNDPDVGISSNKKKRNNK